MMNQNKWLKFLLIVCTSLGLTSNARANSLTFAMGYFDIVATVGNASGGVAGFGNYKLAYLYDITSNISLNLGYTLLMENTVGGDSSYGLDMGVQYSPLAIKYNDYNSGGLSIKIRPKWDPFVGLGFHQRQYQSVKSAYSGLGLSVGTNYDIGQSFLLYTSLRMISLTGPLDATATENSINFGVTLKI